MQRHLIRPLWMKNVFFFCRWCESARFSWDLCKLAARKRQSELEIRWSLDAFEIEIYWEIVQRLFFRRCIYSKMKQCIKLFLPVPVIRSLTEAMIEPFFHSSFQSAIFQHSFNFFFTTALNSSRDADAPTFFSRIEEINFIMESHDSENNVIKCVCRFFVSL